MFHLRWCRGRRRGGRRRRCRRTPMRSGSRLKRLRVARAASAPLLAVFDLRRPDRLRRKLVIDAGHCVTARRLTHGRAASAVTADPRAAVQIHDDGKRPGAVGPSQIEEQRLACRVRVLDRIDRCERAGAGRRGILRERSARHEHRGNDEGKKSHRPPKTALPEALFCRGLLHDIGGANSNAG